MYFASGALARKMEKLALESWKNVGLSPSHAYLLIMVIEDPGMQPGHLAEELKLSPSTVTRLIEKLEEKKLALRKTEGKTTCVFPTPKGKDMLPQLRSCQARFYESYISILGKEESAKLVQGINRLTDKL